MRIRGEIRGPKCGLTSLGGSGRGSRRSSPDDFVQSTDDSRQLLFGGSGHSQDLRRPRFALSQDHAARLGLSDLEQQGFLLSAVLVADRNHVLTLLVRNYLFGLLRVLKYTFT